MLPFEAPPPGRPGLVPRQRHRGLQLSLRVMRENSATGFSVRRLWFVASQGSLCRHAAAPGDGRVGWRAPWRGSPEARAPTQPIVQPKRFRTVAAPLVPPLQGPDRSGVTARLTGTAGPAEATCDARAGKPRAGRFAGGVAGMRLACRDTSATGDRRPAARILSRARPRRRRNSLASVA